MTSGLRFCILLVIWGYSSAQLMRVISAPMSRQIFRQRQRPLTGSTGFFQVSDSDFVDLNVGRSLTGFSGLGISSLDSAVLRGSGNNLYLVGGGSSDSPDIFNPYEMMYGDIPDYYKNALAARRLGLPTPSIRIGGGAFFGGDSDNFMLG